ncbi:hypothetical protein CPLU01_01882 [Colletotrichum plurivorum]|uniref:Uncharacterized protein n=1 Tax=Colletotrichum plurivorum TaxID=2175906 RepID=A0A8H6NMV4_9PEZI|nr:hypothetical protein CPLU01_01882 [Colletotrichum plurivorum]
MTQRGCAGDPPHLWLNKAATVASPTPQNAVIDLTLVHQLLPWRQLEPALTPPQTRHCGALRHAALISSTVNRQQEQELAREAGFFEAVYIPRRLLASPLSQSSRAQETSRGGVAAGGKLPDRFELAYPLALTSRIAEFYTDLELLASAGCYVITIGNARQASESRDNPPCPCGLERSKFHRLQTGISHESGFRISLCFLPKYTLTPGGPKLLSEREAAPIRGGQRSTTRPRLRGKIALAPAALGR